MDSFGCVNNTIKIASGYYMDLLQPTPEMVDIYSIAHALSQTCRFGGHCPMFYSVAEHSVQAARLASSPYNLSVLLHDAAEAYIGDIVRPLKRMLPDLSLIEERLDAVIRERFVTDHSPDEIKRCDELMLKAEKVRFWPDDTLEWDGFSGLDVPNVEIVGWSPVEARRRFILEFDRWMK